MDTINNEIKCNYKAEIYWSINQKDTNRLLEIKMITKFILIFL